MNFGYVIHYVSDVVSTLEFYERAFGLTERTRHLDGEMAYGELETGETVLAFASEALAASHGFEFRRQRPDSLPSPMEIALVTNDVDAAFARAVDAGAVALKPPTEEVWGQTVSYVRDCNGAVVEICSPVSPPGGA